MTASDQLSLQRRDRVVVGGMFSVFAIIALVLAAVGLYAVTAHSVVQRTQEIGIRMALGAAGGQVRWLFVRKLLIQLAVGVSVGLAGAVGVGTVMQTLLFGVGAYDPVTLVGIAAILSAAAAIACYWPTRRATRVDPIVALRYE